jgi:hypothetical protein
MFFVIEELVWVPTFEVGLFLRDLPALSFSLRSFLMLMLKEFRCFYQGLALFLHLSPTLNSHLIFLD